MSRCFSFEDQEPNFQGRPHPLPAQPEPEKLHLPSAQSDPSLLLTNQRSFTHHHPQQQSYRRYSPRHPETHSHSNYHFLSDYPDVEEASQNLNPQPVFSFRQEGTLPSLPTLNHNSSPPPPPPHRKSLAVAWAPDQNFVDYTPGLYNAHAIQDWGIESTNTAREIDYWDADVHIEGTEADLLTSRAEHTIKMNDLTDDHSNRSTPICRPDTSSEPSQSSPAPLAAVARTPGNITPQSRSTVSRSPYGFNRDPFVDVSYRYSRNIEPGLEDFDPNSIEDDGDDGLDYRQRHRSSMLSLGNSDRNSLPTTSSGGKAGKNPTTGQTSNTQPEATGKSYFNVRSGDQSHPNSERQGEKSEWLSKQSNGRSKLRMLVFVIVGFLTFGAIAGGVVGGILGKRNSEKSSPTGQSASTDQLTNGDLNKDSAEIKALANNPQLHKVFPALDYTPFHTRYPDCMHDPPSQNNITRDMAILSQLTNTVRLYGTDCNQTEMVIHSIERLGLSQQVKIWMGVWLDKNVTTNTRQLSQMYDIFNQYGPVLFKGVIVGNEVLFRQDMTTSELGEILSDVKANLTAKDITLPVASSDLGDDWTAELASKTDILMANIHPFFAGVSADAAASWTWDFWQEHNVALEPKIKNIISETGWPSSGGISCGGASSCTSGSVASVDALNTFMNDWVCQALKNGTEYFWFEAFDEPWKINFNEPGKEWEDKWGLLDINRKLKPGVVIPSCGGKTVN
ncbi:BgTH12-02146 [Blumeria graminis f. sp. triticale]|uniref:glucan endo-1,3-beta-D-glucosidase n=3 Tax=Blumeria graminis TaxID=34373 RepID=A0A061HLY2_BLUGR|nr:Cell wall protein [Blumeria graminis f. sp. tritici 96224]CAD6501901.1 BgTH12-02146 [Blumeria graminis f. sp. triticale]VDB85827.1 Bgt-1266 [Blumeria graminis f. sp. tritici]